MGSESFVQKMTIRKVQLCGTSGFMFSKPFDPGESNFMYIYNHKVKYVLMFL